MTKNTPIINILTYGLPYDLANQIYNEFQDRYREANYIIEISPRYKTMSEYLKTVELLLAMSIFHKRVISNLDGAVKFYGTVTKYSEAKTIAIGRYEFTGSEKNKILRLLISYRNLMYRFNIPENIMDYHLTKEFLLNIKRLKTNLDYADTQNKKQNRRGQKNAPDEDIPF